MTFPAKLQDMTKLLARFVHSYYVSQPKRLTPQAGPLSKQVLSWTHPKER